MTRSLALLRRAHTSGYVTCSPPSTLTQAMTMGELASQSVGWLD